MKKTLLFVLKRRFTLFFVQLQVCSAAIFIIVTETYNIPFCLLDFVKIILPKNDNFGLALRKRLFCIAKQPLLPCKTYAFGMQNNKFCNALIVRWLCDSFVCEKYLQRFDVLSVYQEHEYCKTKYRIKCICYKKCAFVFLQK